MQEMSFGDALHILDVEELVKDKLMLESYLLEVA